MFEDRADAGRRLAAELLPLGLPDPVVLALPRGGVAVAAEVARALGAPLDLVMVRKVGVPGHEELAAGAVVDGAGPALVRNEEVIRAAGVTEEELAAEAARQLGVIGERRRLYLGGRARVAVAGRTAVVVDDGIATGATVLAALGAVRRAGPVEVVLAVPVAPPETLRRLEPHCDRIVCPARPEDFRAVGQFYRDFRQVEDEEVVALLAGARPAGAAG